ncbi:DUF3558 family protein [Pseudonocardia xishanensis]|uniref:DUF3558 domain-containing protein n=1 Tax=Pseudonocardia xishanensis TaxID=630995 RepID=A0ABP8RE90_9PSEU
MTLALAACSAGPPSPPPSDNRAEIAQPLDLTGHEACDLVGPAALTRLSLKLDSVERGSGPTATSCAWRSADGTVGLQLVANSGVGLDRLSSVTAAFEEETPLVVSGYPGLRIDHLGGPTCRIAVGVAPTQLISAEASELSTSAPPLCDLAQALAEETVAALRGV